MKHAMRLHQLETKYLLPIPGRALDYCRNVIAEQNYFVNTPCAKLFQQYVAYKNI